MFYLFVQIFVWISLTFLLGFLLGWWIKSLLGFEKTTSIMIKELQNTLADCQAKNDVLRANINKADRESDVDSQIHNTEQSPACLYSEVPAQIDDLEKIKGIGPKLSTDLNGLGIYHWEQIANFSDSDIQWLNKKMSFSGRIERDEWVAQAKHLCL